MRITVLIDNNTLQKDLVAEKGFSAFIEADDKNVLFDTGKDGNLVANAKALNIDLRTIDIVAISHGHHDHVNGLKSLIELFVEGDDNRRRKLIIHPRAFVDRWNIKKETYIGTELKEEEISKYFDIQFSTEPVFITDALIWSGEIEKVNDFEKVSQNYHTKEGVDKIEDDAALIYKSKEGLVVIPGCSHSGICNILRHAKKIGDDNRVADIIGGIHLKDSNMDHIKRTISEVRRFSPQALHFCHCTGEAAYSYLKEKENLNFSSIGCGWSKSYI